MGENYLIVFCEVLALLCGFCTAELQLRCRCLSSICSPSVKHLFSEMSSESPTNFVQRYMYMYLQTTISPDDALVFHNFTSFIFFFFCRTCFKILGINLAWSINLHCPSTAALVIFFLSLPHEHFVKHGSGNVHGLLPVHNKSSSVRCK